MNVRLSSTNPENLVKINPVTVLPKIIKSLSCQSYSEANLITFLRRSVDLKNKINDYYCYSRFEIRIFGAYKLGQMADVD